jgi:hypothetical protein
MKLNKLGTDTPNSKQSKDYTPRAAKLYGGDSLKNMHDTDRVLEISERKQT